MADITCCDGEFCSKKDTCYRYLAKRDRYQSMFIIPEEYQGEKCREYWEDGYGIAAYRNDSFRQGHDS